MGQGGFELLRDSRTVGRQEVRQEDKETQEFCNYLYSLCSPGLAGSLPATEENMLVESDLLSGRAVAWPLEKSTRYLKLHFHRNP